MKGRRAGLLIVQTLLGLALLMAWLYLVDLHAIYITLSQARWNFIFLAVVICLLCIALRALRWRIVLRPLIEVPLLDMLLISAASNLVNFIIPLRTGEIARSLLLKQRRRISIAISLPTVVVDRSFDLVAVLVLVAVGALSGIQLGDRLSVILLAGGVLFLVIVAFIILAVLFSDRLLATAAHLLPNRASSTLRNRILGILKKFISGFKVVGRQPRVLALLITISISCAVFDAASFYCLFLSVGASIPPPVVLTGYALFVLTFLVPGGPGYIGSMEAFGSLIFCALGVEVEVAASSVVLFHTLNAVVIGVSGGLGMWALGLHPSSTMHQFVDVIENDIIPDQPGAEN